MRVLYVGVFSLSDNPQHILRVPNISKVRSPIVPHYAQRKRERILDIFREQKR